MSDKPNPIEELALLIGKASVAWTNVHYLVFLAFTRLSGMPPAISDAAFYSLKNDTTQRDMTLAVARIALNANGDFDTLKTILKDIGKQAGVRNEAVHTSWAVAFKSGDGPVVSQPTITKARTPAFVEGEDFSAKFTKLTEDLQSINGRLVAWHRDVQIPSPRKAPEQKDQR